MRGDVVFVWLLKMTYDLIVFRRINLKSHLSRVANARENARARRASRAIRRGKPAYKIGLNGPPEEADQFTGILPCFEQHE